MFKKNGKRRKFVNSFKASNKFITFTFFSFPPTLYINLILLKQFFNFFFINNNILFHVGFIYSIHHIISY